VSLIISFQGLDADEGRLEAFAGIESAAGISRSLALIAHYAATGEVRRRFPFSEDVQFYLEGTEEGSFNWRLVLAASGGLAMGLTTNAVYDLSKVVLTRAIGEEEPPTTTEVENLNKHKSGDIDALVEAIEPALKKGHYGIGGTTQKIVIREEQTHTLIVTFDDDSKQYLMESKDAGSDVQDVSVSALNVNDKTGRAYFLDLKRTVPFRIDRHATPDTISVLSGALDEYANEHVAPVRISFKRIEASDGRLKRVVIYDAEDITEEE
jgi:hypothetical protein